jgi:hypothetical protein
VWFLYTMVLMGCQVLLPFLFVLRSTIVRRISYLLKDKKFSDRLIPIMQSQRFLSGGMVPQIHYILIVSQFVTPRSSTYVDFRSWPNTPSIPLVTSLWVVVLVVPM